jgi:hypothetical protein
METVGICDLAPHLADEPEHAERTNRSRPEASLLVERQGSSSRVLGCIKPSRVAMSDPKPIQSTGKNRSECRVGSHLVRFGKEGLGAILITPQPCQVCQTNERGDVTGVKSHLGGHAPGCLE